MIEITPRKLHQIDEIERVILTVFHKIWQLPLEVILRYDFLSDLHDVKSHYFDNNGTFLVLIDNDIVVESGALRRLDKEICELKRRWFLKNYRGQGLGRKMTEMLLDFARIKDYKKARLDLTDVQKQS